MTVSEDVLDSGKIPHGATIGIPYAPDRLPPDSEAESAKRWAVCERPGEGGRAIQKAAFVLAKRDLGKTEGRESKLSGGDLMYVVGPDKAKTEYVVDAHGTAYPIEQGTDKEQLLRALGINLPAGQKPERVSRDWLDTLNKGTQISFPKLSGNPGAAARTNSTLDGTANRVGMVLKTPDQYYVVLSGTVAPITDFTAHLLLYSPDLIRLGQRGEPLKVSPGAVVSGQSFGPANWPKYQPNTVNEATTTAGSRNTVCNVLDKVDSGNGRTTLSTWAGKNFPAPCPSAPPALTSPPVRASSTGSSRAPRPTWAPSSWSPTRAFAMRCSPTATAAPTTRASAPPRRSARHGVKRPSRR